MIVEGVQLSLSLAITVVGFSGEGVSCWRVLTRLPRVWVDVRVLPANDQPPSATLSFLASVPAAADHLLIVVCFSICHDGCSC